MRDVIFIGECRSAYTAKMAIRASLTGHLVFTTLHAGSGRECLHRLLEFGIDREDLKSVIQSVFAQRLFPSVHGRECVYEIWKHEDLVACLDGQEVSIPSLQEEVQLAADQGWILPESLERPL